MKSIFEILMLVCFGAAWPASIVRSYRSRTAKGKSAVFSIIILVGYVCGTINKLINNPNYVMYLYILNFVMVAIDLGLWFRNRNIDRQNDAKAAAKAGN